MATHTLIYDTETCPRCGGTGRMPFAAYGGVCFKCTGKGVVMTAAGRSAAALYRELVDAACETKQAWEVAEGERVTYGHDQANRWFTVTRKDFSSTGGQLAADGSPLGSAVLESPRAVHLVTPDTVMKVRPATAVLWVIMDEVARRRKGARVEVTEG